MVLFWFLFIIRKKAVARWMDIINDFNRCEGIGEPLVERVVEYSGDK